MRVEHIGLLFTIFGIILIIIGTMKSNDVKFAFGGFIGPIPFGFGNDLKLLVLILFTSLILLLLFLSMAQI